MCGRTCVEAPANFQKLEEGEINCIHFFVLQNFGISMKLYFALFPNFKMTYY
jgi:hypothetical protein